ncbi:MAG: hypothetical protein VR68_15210 [Peptococcaceae bacterium BRH_c4a]|nr:MAG: hypothetical protein VR68_15210 [Peptococcaceae bacterium BRH_c4a]
MKRRIKKIALALFLVFLSFYVYLYLWYIPEYTTIDKHFKRIPGELYVYRSGKEIPFIDTELIKQFSSLVKSKKGKKINLAEVNKIKNDSILHFDYGYKEDSMWIAGDGRIMFAVDKAEIRNRSIIGYLWWEIASDKSIYMYYATDPDPEVTIIANGILKKMIE